MSRLWLALVIALFCLPLFIGLGDRDLANDEAIYSFAVDRILEDGDWLGPKASPEREMPFHEKPPLKFWMVAAPIALGILPHNEFGLRFWDALFGGVAFVYVFLIGRRLMNAIAGAVAVLALFAHMPLLFDHGLRDNAMEAPLVLAYCGGIYHFLVWSAAEGPARRARHAVATGLFFVLGFMVKFVAALFLPLVLGVAVLAVEGGRERVRRDWRLWAGVGALVIALIAPWFVYAHLRYGSSFWVGMFGEHVYRRFTGALDPGHVQPWYFYFLTLYQRLSDSGIALLAVAGFAMLFWQANARKRLEALVIIVWAVLPVVLMSVGTSKLGHYTYPFLPAFALAAGYAIAMLLALAPAPFERSLHAFERHLDRAHPRMAALGRNPAFRALLLAGVAVSIALAIASLVLGSVRFDLTDTVTFRSTGIFRPALVAFLFALPLGLAAGARRVLPLLVISFLPLPAYRVSLTALKADDEDPYRSITRCLRRVDEEHGDAPRGLYAPWPNLGIWHPVNYYFRRVQPMEHAAAADPAKVLSSAGAGQGDDQLRPILIYGTEYRRLPSDVRTAIPDPIDLRHDGWLILPGRYAACAVDAPEPEDPR